MLKLLALVLALALAGIPYAFGEIELPPLPLECLEDFQNLYPKMFQMVTECRQKYLDEHELDYDEYLECYQDWVKSDSDAIALNAKCEHIERDLSPAQNGEVQKRLVEIIQGFQTSG